MTIKKDMERSYLFYAANFDPEVHRIEESLRAGERERAQVFIEKTLRTIDALLSAKDISPAGKEEWSAIRSLVASYTNNTEAVNNILLSYDVPFSQKFACR